MDNSTLRELIEKGLFSIRHYDDVEAKKLLKEIVSVLASPNTKQTNPEFFQKLQKLLIYLKITAIPQLSDEEVVDVLRNHYLESYDMEIDMENRLTVKLFFVPEIPRDELRKKLKRAILENQQKLGPLTVSQWIYEFEKAYPVQTRGLNASVDFMISNKNALSLDTASKANLKELLHVYDYLLVQTLPATGPILNEILNATFPADADSYESNPYIMAPSSSPGTPSTSPAAQSSNQPVITQVNFQEILKKSPEFGEQLITSSYIKIKSFPQPVRPSIKNWIADYTSYYGYTNHNQMIRGEYLFKNENAKILPAQEKEKLSYVLKAFDENDTINIDMNSKQIVFPTHSSTESLSAIRQPAESRKDSGERRQNPPAGVQNPPPSGARSNFETPARRDSEISNSSNKISDFQNLRQPTNNALPGSARSIQPTQKRDSFQFSDDNYFANFSPSYNRPGVSEQETVNNKERKIEADHRLMPSSYRNNPPETAKIDFSSPQKLPFEKEIEAKTTHKETPKEDLQPFRISPSKKFPKSNFEEREERPLPKNVVNLRE